MQLVFGNILSKIDYEVKMPYYKDENKRIIEVTAEDIEVGDPSSRCY